MIPMFKVFMSDKASGLVSSVLGSGMVGEGPKVKEFKSKLENKLDTKNLIPLNSCTSALTLALRVAGVKPGSEVISTPFTMIATNVAIMALGAKIVWADVLPNSPNVDVKDVFRKVTTNTTAIMVTHVAGVPVDTQLLYDVNVPIIGDCAHAILTTFENMHIHYYSDFSCFSFQAIKQLNSADGGALVCTNYTDYELAEKLKWFGMSRNIPAGMNRLEWQMKQDVTEWGYKFHMNDVTAAIGLANLEHLDQLVKKQNRIANYYLENIPKEMQFDIPLNCSPSWWLFPVRLKDREKYIGRFVEKEIEVSPMWRRNDHYRAFSDFTARLPNLDKLEKEILFLPCGWWLTLDDAEQVVKIIKS